MGLRPNNPGVQAAKATSQKKLAANKNVSIKGKHSELAEDFAPPPASKDQMKKIQEAIESATKKMAEVDGLNEYISGVNKEITLLLEKTIPEAMGEANCTEFKLEDGTKVRLADYIRGSLPKDDEPRGKALAWITRNDGEDIIKATLEATFPRGDKKAADKARAALRKLRIEFKDVETVHAQTLYAFVREKLKRGENVPLEMLGLFGGRAAKITTPKKREED